MSQPLATDVRRESPRRTTVPPVNLDEMEAVLKARLKALPPAARAELVHVLRLPDFDRVGRIGEFWGHPGTRTFGELLIDLEEDKAAQAVVFGLLREIGLPPHGDPALVFVERWKRTRQD